MSKSQLDVAADADRGARNENPKGISLLSLLFEDFQTHDCDLLEPGFWALAVHRFGNWRMDVAPPARAPLTLAYRAMHHAVRMGFGIDLGYTVKVGRRLRIWHHGGIVLGARSIGDDVHIRQNTTFGVQSRHEPDAKPTIGDRVDIGAGACVLGEVSVGDDAVIGANTVVVRNVAAGSVVLGVPARPVQLRAAEEPAPARTTASTPAARADYDVAAGPTGVKTSASSPP